MKSKSIDRHVKGIKPEYSIVTTLQNHVHNHSSIEYNITQGQN